EQQRAEQGWDAPDAEFDRWSEQARRRMGDERFESWIGRMAESEPEKYDRLRRGFERHGRAGHGPHGHGPRGGYGRGFDPEFDRERADRRGFGRGGHGHGFDPDAREHHRR
ncbi:hypothetical protein, partial [Gulosibacter sediminis]